MVFTDGELAYLSPEIIRIHPRRIISWGTGQDGSESSSRTVR